MVVRVIEAKEDKVTMADLIADHVHEAAMANA